jgi:hypothetical protein
MKKLYDFKKHFLIAVFVITATLAHSQNYDFSAMAGTFVQITGGTNLPSVQADDVLSSAIPIGFTFNYFGNNVTQLKVSSNGFVTFNTTSTSPLSSNQISGYRSIIAPLWDDLDGSTGTANYVVTGTSPNRVFTMEWLNWNWNWLASGAGISFQLKLYETSNRIEFCYRSEPGALEDPSATIGITGPNAVQFYSLANSAVSPSLALGGFDEINSKPASGQVYSFTPAVAPVAPTIQTSNVITSNDVGTQLTLNWTNGNGAYRAVFMKQTTSTSETFTPTDNELYQSSDGFGNYIYGASWSCVYNGSGSTVTVDGLVPGATYRIQVIEYNGLAGNQMYLNAASINNPVNVTTTIAAPESPFSELSLVRVSGSETSISMQEGNGSFKAVFLKQGTATTVPLVNTTTYSANETFGLGNQVGSSGWYCVYNGTGFSTPLKVLGLSPNTTYSIFISDYNGDAGLEHYNTISTEENTLTFITLPNSQVPTYNFTASTTTFTPIVSGTSLDLIEDDEGIVTGIPIGFTFYFAGNPVTTLTASSNGLLSFNPYYDGLIDGSPDFGDNDLDNNVHARPLLAPLWDDLAGFNGTASYITTGIGPNRVFTIEFLNWSWIYWAATPGISFQVRLHETSNAIEYIYRQESGSLSFPSASIGLAFANLGTGNFISLNNSGASPIASTSAETSSIGTKPATGQVYAFTPQAISQTITFASLSAKAFGDAAFQLNATASSGLNVEYTSSDPSIASIAGNTVTIHAAGTIDITAIQTGNIVFAAAVPVTQTLTVNKGDQLITCPAIPQKMYGEPVFNLEATTTSGLPLTYQSDNTSVVTVAGNSVTITGPGTASILISQAGDANYNAAADLLLPITVVKADQVITFPVIETKTLGDNAFALSANSNSGLPITYSTASTKVALTGNMVTINSAGSVTIQASQSGNANYNAATPVEQTFCINPPKPVITLSTSDDGLVLSSSAPSNNQWSRNGSVLTGATNQTYIVDGPGEYKVTTSVEGCQSTPSDGKTILITDVEDTASTISVAPNPVTGDFTIQGLADKATAVLFDQAGRQIQSKEGNEEITMSLRTHPAAMYFLKIQTTRGLVFKKIIKK